MNDQLVMSPAVAVAAILIVRTTVTVTVVVESATLLGSNNR
jgi:hypothetical protein